MATEKPEAAASNLLERVWNLGTGSVPTPVDPVFIAQQLGLWVFQANLEPDTAGMLVKRVGQAAEIYVNRSDPPNRRRFTTAHEIGHYIERTQGVDDEAWEFVDRRNHVSGKGSDAHEIYANRFAAELLMPADSVRKRRNSTDAQGLAVEFQVSVEAMKNRLDTLRRF